MSPSPLDLVTRRLGGRVVPWITYYRVARQVLDRARGGWGALTPAERTELARILRESHGRPAAVTPANRVRVRQLVIKAGKGAARPGRRQK